MSAEELYHAKCPNCKEIIDVAEYTKMKGK